MAKLSLQLKLGQQLAMTPQLQQAIRLLQMPVMELNAQIQEALESNVMLEQEEPSTLETMESDPDEANVEVVEGEDFESSWDEPGNNSSLGDNNLQPDFADESTETLKQHLLWQIEMEQFSPREVVIAQTLVDYINDDGYLTETLQNIADFLPQGPEFKTAEIEVALSKLQTLDPIGVGARDLSECIQLQLQQLDANEPGLSLALNIATTSLEFVADNELTILRRNLGDQKRILMKRSD